MRIVLVEDHLMVLDALRKACERDFGHEVVGEATRGDEALPLILRTRPDVVILDLSLPEMDGFAVAAGARKALPSLRILVLSAHCDDYTLFRVERSGVNGFVDKNGNPLAEIDRALQAIAQGKCYYSDFYHAAKLARRTDPRSFTKILSDRERVVLGLIGHGLTDDEIGQRLGITPRTAATHRSNILRKLNIAGSTKLIAFAHEHGFTSLPARRGTFPVYS